jgi:hypothetical protein
MEQLVVDNSILSATAKCHTYAFTRYALGYDVKGEALALSAGQAIHLGMERWMKGEPVKKCVKAMAEWYEHAVTVYLHTTEQDQLGPDDKRFEPERVIAIFHAHLLKLEEQFPFKIIEGAVEGPIWAEFPIDLPVPVIYVARLDAIVRKRELTGRWSFDHKSTKRITDWWSDKQKVSSQWSGQVWIEQQQRHRALEGVIIHAIELPEPHTSDRTCKEHGVPFTECSIRHATYDYIYVTRSQAELDGWLTTATQQVREFHELTRVAAAAGIEAVGEVQMQGRFNEGCVFCSMKEWCRLGRPTGERQLRAMFVENPWNPLKEG